MFLAHVAKYTSFAVQLMWFICTGNLCSCQAECQVMLHGSSTAK